MKSLCGLSLWTKDCHAETVFHIDTKREKQTEKRGIYKLYNIDSIRTL